MPDEVTAEELAAYSPRSKGRIEKLLNERRELRAHLEQFKAIEPQAQAAASVQQYLRDNDISREDFMLTLELAASMRKGDFEAFYAGIKPYVTLAEEYLGVSLPADLQQAVRSGQMTTQAAAMYSRERMDRGLAQSRNMRAQQLHQEQSQTMQQQLQAQQQQQLAVNVRDHVNAWEQTMMRSDPDYAAAKPLLHDVMWSVVREKGAPQSPEQAVEIAKEAYSRVKGHVAPFTPQRRPTSRVPSSTGRTNGAAPEPNSLREAVVQAMDRARA